MSRLLANKVVEYPGKKPGSGFNIVCLNQKDVAEIEDSEIRNIIDKLAVCYRNIFAGEPWNEYLFCKNSECEKTYGLESGADFSESDKAVVENSRVCGECGSGLDFVFPPEQLVDNLRNIFSDKIYASLLYDEMWDLHGFSLGVETTVKEGYFDKIIAGSGETAPCPSVDIGYSKYLEELRSLIGYDYKEDNALFNIGEWGVDNFARAKGVALPLFYETFRYAQENFGAKTEPFTPAIAYSLVGSKSFQLVDVVDANIGVEKDKKARIYSTLPRILNSFSKLINK